MNSRMITTLVTLFLALDAAQAQTRPAQDWSLPTAAQIETLLAAAVKSPPVHADTLLNAALRKAKAENKVVWLVFSPQTWCVPCRKLKAFLGAPETGRILREHFVVQEITVAETLKNSILNNPFGHALRNKLAGERSGVPHTVFLDPTDAVSPLAQLKGVPSNEKTIEMFEGDLALTAPQMTGAERAVLVKYLRDQRGAVSSLSGSVLDASERPVASARISLFARLQLEGQWKPVFARSIVANVAGTYEMAGIAPGDYWIRVEEPVVTASAAASATPRYTPSFYTSGAQAGTPALITVEPGEDRTALDVVLPPLAEATLSGIVVGSSGRVIAGAQVTITEADIPVSVRSVTAAANGSFSFANLHAGTYNVWARTPPSASGAATEFGMTSIAVRRGGADSLRIALSSSATLAGRLTISEGAMTDADRAALAVTAIGVAAPAGAPPGNPLGSVQRDGRFEIRNLFGSRVVRVVGLPPGWMIENITRGGVDITDRPIDIGTTTRVDNIEVRVTNRSAGVRGTVVDSAQRPAPNKVIVAFAADSAKWSYPSRFLRIAPTDAAGAFSIQGLPPGSYLLAPVESMERSWDSPESLSRLRARATPIEVRQNENRRVTVPIKSGGE